MTKCSFCGSKEDKTTPVCQTCGALRYPVSTKHLSAAPLTRQEKLKLSAALAVIAITPGAFIALALAGATLLNKKTKK